MPTSTSRLNLTQPAGSDSPSLLRTSIGGNATTLDNAVLVTEGTLAARPAPSTPEHNHIYRTTDAGAETYGITDGSVWFPLGLIPASTSSNGTAVSGQALITTGSSALTITLPAAAQGALCAVINRSSNVTTVSGSNIQGLGLSSASSFTLGAVGAAATLISDGTNWIILAGQQDSGWVALTLGSGVSAVGDGITVAARLQGNVVRLQGFLKASSGTVSAGSTLATVPAALQPANNVFFAGTLGPETSGASAMSAAIIEVGFVSSGAITANQAITTTNGIQLYGMSYPLT